MDKQGKIILVTGATGKQGGAVADHLLKNGWAIRVLTRDPGKPAAKHLTERGAEVVKGDLDDCDSVRRALSGCYGVYAVQTFWEVGVEGEIRQGKALADDAKAAGVRHFVYSSVGSADQDTGIPHFDSKWQIEEHIRSLDLPHTIIRPVWFMDNFNSPDFRRSILRGELALPLRPDKPLQMVAVNDIGAFAALAFDDPQRWNHRAFDLAGDELTLPEVASMISQVIGLTVSYHVMPMSQAEAQSREMAVMFRWFNELGYQADIQGLRRLYPELLTFGAWMYAAGWQELAEEIAAARGA
jgi:uncharacterized protein YbjT (DUF2867 family)